MEPEYVPQSDERNTREVTVESWSLEQLREMLLTERRSVAVEAVRDGMPHWQIVKGRLVNLQSDFFSIGAVTDRSGAPRFLIRQTEEVLVMLLVTRTETGISALLSVRSEPGLIGLTCFTTTIQSTRSNYMRKHGGKATRYLEFAQDPTLGTVLHDSVQYDWGDLYEGKTKRFLVIETDYSIQVEDGFAWVPWTLMRQLLLADHLVTNDLRACLALMMVDIEGSRVAPTSSSPGVASGEGGQPRNQPFDSYQDLQELQTHNGTRHLYQDGFGNEIAFHRTTAKSREVPNWTQPLLHVGNDKLITLYAVAGETTLYPLRIDSQLGSPGTQLWAPSEPASHARGTRTTAMTSGEGGRFYQHLVQLELVSVNPEVARCSEWPDGTVWMTHEQVQALITCSLTTSLELRLSWSLLFGQSV